MEVIMAGTSSSFYNNYGRFKVKGTFDLSSSAAVNTLTYPAGGTKTVRGRGMTVTKASTGTYTVVIQTSNSTGGPVIPIVELVDGDAGLTGSTVAGALNARIGGAPPIDANGNINVTVITGGSTGAATDTTAAITIS